MSTSQGRWVLGALALVAIAALGLAVSTWLLNYEPRCTVTPGSTVHEEKWVNVSTDFWGETVTVTSPASTETIEAVTEQHHPSWATPLAIGIITLTVGGCAVLLLAPRRLDKPA